MEATLALENGTVFKGVSIGADGVAEGEVVFNTALTGYQEVLTDPSYAGQIVTMTCPEIGNYGVADEDHESRRAQVAGFVVRQASPIASNWRADAPLQEYLRSRNVVAIADIDTRALTRMLRSAGVMRGVIAAGRQNAGDLVDRARAAAPMEGADWVQRVTCEAPFAWSDPETYVDEGLAPPPLRRADQPVRVAAYDYGMKWNILRRFTAYGFTVEVFPAGAPARDVLATDPDGIFLSNGPGDPAALDYAVESARALVDSGRPVFGICLGHQVLARALGGSTFKLKFGHRGANHPVKFLPSGQVEITSQNHGFAVDPRTLPADVEVTHVNLYDGTLEGFRHKTLPVFCVQYHPEAAPGPHDADYLFRQFLDEVEARRTPSRAGR